ncbi:copper-binding protein [Roseobacter cerasinus]|uniref:Copper-binding protein n=1 Tax=Roseobacter cerasinus TaxID=2602289 RepID=A0A640VVW5_9RHOB|nr:SCO family protein [Roseobacter cerasinus]GFE51231.1 copper-binding protein [Roseobacter cerasinus]
MLRALALAVLAASGAAAETPLPFDLGGAYALTNQFGETRTQADPQGHAQLLFFGYANCLNICSAALPLMAEVVDMLAEEGIAVTPVMITVAPEQDRIETMGAPLAEIHRDFIGLTGDQRALQIAYDAFAIAVEPLFEDPEYGWIYSHGSFVHLLDGEGEMLTLLPPVLDADRTADIVRGYLAPRG